MAKPANDGALPPILFFRLPIVWQSPALANSAANPLLAAMGYSPVHPDALAESLGRPAADIFAELLELELEGRVAAAAGGCYQRVG